MPDLEQAAAARRCMEAGFRWQAWLEQWERAARHERGCKTCRREVGEDEIMRIVSCPQAPAYPVVDGALPPGMTGGPGEVCCVRGEAAKATANGGSWECPLHFVGT